MSVNIVKVINQGKKIKEVSQFLDENNKPVPLEIAQEILKETKIITLRDNEQIMYFNDGIYHDGAYTLIKEKAQQLVPFISKRYKEEVVELIKGLTYTDRTELNKYKYYIPVKNGIYDIENKKLIPHDPNILITRQIPIEYDPNATCPKIKEFIKEVVGEDQIKIAQELFGYCLINDYSFNKAFMLFGSGKNGKTTFLNLLIGFLGEDNINSASLQDLCYNRFARKDLFGKLANIYDDLPKTPLTHTGNFKILTGMGKAYADVKFKEHFEFVNTAKLIFSCNELPETDDTTIAFFRRWIIVNFPYMFDGKKCDPTLPQSIMSPQEMSGLFNWALEGLNRIYEQKGFSTSKTTEDIESEWILRTDPLRAFVTKNIEYSPTDYITKEEFARKLNEFCIDHNSAEITKQKIGQRLPAILPKITIERIYINGKQERIWKGIKFKERKNKSEKQARQISKLLLNSSIKEGNNTLLKTGLNRFGLLSYKSSKKEEKKHINPSIKDLKNEVGEEFTEDIFINYFKKFTDLDEKYAKDALKIWLDKGIIYEFKPKRYKWSE